MENKIESVEESLLSIFPIKSIQLIGYIPLFVNKEGSLTFRPFGIWTAYPVLLLLTNLLVIGINAANFKELSQLYLKITWLATDLAAIFIVLTTGCVYCIVLKCWGIMSGDSLQDMWQRFCSLVERFPHSLHFKTALANVKSSTRISISVCYLFGVLQILSSMYSYTYALLSSTFKEDPSTFIALWLSQMLNIVLLYSHSFYPLWMTTYLKIYACCLSTISMELSSITFQYENFFSRLETATASLFFIPMRSKEILNGGSGTAGKPSEEMEKKIAKILELIQCVETQIDEFNGYFGLRLFWEIILCILSLVTYAFISISFAQKDNLMLAVSPIPISILTWKTLYEIGTDATHIQLEAKNVLAQLHKIYNLELSVGMRNKIQMLCIKMSTIPTQISASNYFYLNRQFISSVLSSISAYLVILIQFRGEEIKDEGCRQQFRDY